jgi:hypothetical protein
MAVKSSINRGTSYGAILSSAVDPVVYTPINPGGLTQACFLLQINNYSDQIIILSYDGINDHDQMDTRTTRSLYGGSASSAPNTDSAVWPKGTVVYARSTAGSGAISVAGYYQQQGG